MSVSDRGLAVLRAIVHDFVNEGEPVGSKSIVERHSFGVSAATIRNDMALLEEEQLIAAPHTSSGRIPTDKGYRLYVDTLANIRPLNAAQRSAIERFLGESENLDDVMARTVRLLANLTRQVAVIQYPSSGVGVVKQVELVAMSTDRVLCVLITSTGVVEQHVVRIPNARVDEAWVQGLRDRIAAEILHTGLHEAQRNIATLSEQVRGWPDPSEHEPALSVLSVIDEQLRANRNQRIAVAGTANLTRPGEYFQNLAAVLEAVEEQVVLLRLIQELATDERGLGASIGDENLAYGLSDAALIATQYETGSDELSRLGVLGSTRMNYERNIAAMRAVSRYLGQMLGESNL